MSSKNRNRRRSGNPAKAAQAEKKAIDFDAIRAKRRRVLREIPPVRIDGRDYALSPTLPLAVTEFFAENSTSDEEQNVTAKLADMMHLLALLFGEDQWAEIKKIIDIAEVPALFTTVFGAYGEAVGESSASGEPSESSGQS